MKFSNDLMSGTSGWLTKEHIKPDESSIFGVVQFQIERAYSYTPRANPTNGRNLKSEFSLNVIC